MHTHAIETLSTYQLRRLVAASRLEYIEDGQTNIKMKQFRISFKTEKEAQQFSYYLDNLTDQQQILVIKNNNEFYLDIDKNKFIQIKEYYKQTSNYSSPKFPFYIKSTRNDFNYFFPVFAKMITPSPQNTSQPQSRKGARKAYTVKAEGIFHLYQRKPMYDQNIKKLYSKHQSTSYVPSNLNVPLFAFRNGGSRNKVVTGAIFSEAGVLVNRRFLYDKGTITRPYDNVNYTSALDYQNNVLNKTLFKSANEFKAAIEERLKMPAESLLNSKYNEVLSRLRWLSDGSCYLVVGATNFESRIAVQRDAEILLNRVQEQAKELGIELSDNYYIPISYYLPGNELHLTEYDIFSQAIDKAEAWSIYQKIEKRLECYKENNFEFLFALSNEQIKNALEESLILPNFNGTLLEYMWKANQFYLVVLLLDKICLKIEDYDLLKNLVVEQKIKFKLSDASIAIHNNLPNLLSFMINNGLTEYQPLLPMAIRLGHAEVTSVLINHKVSINTKDDSGGLSLTYAIHIKNNSIKKLFIDYCMREENQEDFSEESSLIPVLHYAAYYNQLDIFNMILNRKINKINELDSNGNTVLHAAAARGSTEILNALVKTSADLNVTNALGETPLHIAAGGVNSFDTVKWFISINNKLINQKSLHGNTPLHFSVSNNNEDIVYFLIKQLEIDLSIKNNQGYDLFTIALIKNHTNLIDFFVESLPKANLIYNLERFQKIYSFVSENDTEKKKLEYYKTYCRISEKLYADNAEMKNHQALLGTIYFNVSTNLELLLTESLTLIDLQNSAGQSALHHAAINGCTSIIQLLFNKKANINLKNNNNETPLILAIKNNQIPTVKLLIQLGANPTSQDIQGKSALSLSENNPELKKLIEQAIDDHLTALSFNTLSLNQSNSTFGNEEDAYELELNEELQDEYQWQEGDDEEYGSSDDEYRSIKKPGI